MEGHRSRASQNFGKVNLDLWSSDHENVISLSPKYCFGSVYAAIHHLWSVEDFDGHRCMTWPWPLTSWPLTSVFPRSGAYPCVKFGEDWSWTVTCRAGTHTQANKQTNATYQPASQISASSKSDKRNWHMLVEIFISTTTNQMTDMCRTYGQRWELQAKM